MDRAAKRDLAGLTAVVTGAAQGLGLGIARELGARGAQVVIADLQLDKAEAECAIMRADGFESSAAATMLVGCIGPMSCLSSNGGSSRFREPLSRIQHSSNTSDCFITVEYGSAL